MFGQHNVGKYKSISSLVLPNILIAKNEVKTSKEAYSQMTLVQKKTYLMRLFGADSPIIGQNDQKIKFIERKIIQHLSTEQKFYSKEDKNMQLFILGNKVQAALTQLQNPSNCSNARILVCKLEQNCGFGCAMHHVSYCLSIASGLGRTLIFEDEGSKWAYNVTWNEIFEQITNCSYLEHVKPFLPIQTYSDPGQNDRIIFLDRRWDMCKVLKKELPHAPEVAPNEIKNLILGNHSNPSLWFLGQIIKFAGRENEKTRNATEQIVSTIPFECGPVVGIHVRLTDKKAETKLHHLEDYMKWVDFWFDVMGQPLINNSLNTNCTNKRMLFIATDEPKAVLEEANKKWGDKYEIYHGRQNAQYGYNHDDPERISRDALIDLLAEIRILSRCQFVVCTFSSNVCRLVYELMQTVQENEMEAIAEYKSIPEYPVSPEEINAERGDVILVKSPILQNGFIRGKNLKTNTEGRFPMYLLKEYVKFENFSAFVNIK
ncbi:hypothetical protein Mgra_00007628 [Meloidogyne graminicola]|uniref:GT23 domain-containing protein n=1 Tax=Meloidogyne graminicola TaxID=189291 RepID=A0A8S9ZHZ1_9BILA|nr:hypothetical protein Mgra_00007628 [Meloidogyne graminicola]